MGPRRRGVLCGPDAFTTDRGEKGGGESPEASQLPSPPDHQRPPQSVGSEVKDRVAPVCRRRRRGRPNHSLRRSLVKPSARLLSRQNHPASRGPLPRSPLIRHERRAAASLSRQTDRPAPDRACYLPCCVSWASKPPRRRGQRFLRGGEAEQLRKKMADRRRCRGSS
jgi:hypothetical protein